MNLTIALRAIIGILTTMFVGIALVVLPTYAASAAPVNVGPVPTRCVTSLTIPTSIALKDQPVEVVATLRKTAECAHTIQHLGYTVKNQDNVTIAHLSFRKNVTAKFTINGPGVYKAFSEPNNDYKNADVTGVAPSYPDSNTLRVKFESFVWLTMQPVDHGRSVILRASASFYDRSIGGLAPWKYAHSAFQVWKADQKWHTVYKTILSNQGKAGVLVKSDRILGYRVLIMGTSTIWGQTTTIR